MPGAVSCLLPEHTPLTCASRKTVLSLHPSRSTLLPTGLHASPVTHALASDLQCPRAPSSSSSSKFKFKSLGLKVQAPGISPCCIRKVLLREMTQCSDLLYNEFMKVRDRILWHMRRLLHVTVFTVRYTILPIHFLPFPHFKKIIYDFIILFSYLHTCFKTPAIQPKSPRKAVSGNTYHLPSQTRVRNEVYASPADKEKLAAARGSNARAAGSPRSTKRHGRVPAQLTSEPWTPDPAH